MTGADLKMKDINSLSHTRWNCQYHIAYAPKQRRKVFYKEKRAGTGKILREVCEWKKIKITEAETCQDHVHILLEIPLEYSVLSFYGTHREKKHFDVIRRVSGTKLQISEPGVVAPRVLHRYGVKEYETDCKVHKAPAG